MKTKNDKIQTVVVIPAAGKGERFGGKEPKQFLELSGMPILIRSVKIFDSVSEIERIIIALNLDRRSLVDSQLKRFGIKKEVTYAEGGATRQESVYNALTSDYAKSSDLVLVHDAARPLATPDLAGNIISAAIEYGAAIPVLKPKDTIKRVSEEGFVEETIDRSVLRTVQTPQGFKTATLLEANEKARKDGFVGTDDASLVERMGMKVKTTQGEDANIKITSKADLLAAEAQLSNESEKSEN